MCSFPSTAYFFVGTPNISIIHRIVNEIHLHIFISFSSVSLSFCVRSCYALAREIEAVMRWLKVDVHHPTIYAGVALTYTDME